MLEEGVLLVECSGTGRCPVCGGLGKRNAGICGIARGCPGRECHVSRASPVHAGAAGLKGRLSGPDGSLTPVGYRDAGVWRQGVRWA